jgi:hypothetical protein
MVFMAKIKCRACGVAFDVPEEARGKIALCPSCGEETPIPKSGNVVLSDETTPPPIFESRALPNWIRVTALAALAIAVIVLIFMALRTMVVKVTEELPLTPQIPHATGTSDDFQPAAEPATQVEPAQNREGSASPASGTAIAAGRVESAAREIEAEEMLTAAAAAEFSSDWEKAEKTYKTIATDYSDTAAGAAVADALQEKIRTLRFMKRIFEARAKFELGGLAAARADYLSVKSEFPESSGSVDAEQELCALAEKASELRSRGLPDEALAVWRAISESQGNSDSGVYWKRLAYRRSAALQSSAAGAAEYFKLASAARDRGELAKALRLFEAAAGASPGSALAADALKARATIAERMPFGRRFRDKDAFLMPDISSAVNRALDWLTRHQSPDGGFSASAFQKQCDGASCTGQGMKDFDAGLTALALLALAGDGNTHLSGKRSESVKKAILYIIGRQDASGNIGMAESERGLYNHALAAQALCEIYAMSADAALKPKAQSAINALISAADAESGWKSGPSAAPDSSATCAAAWALLSAKAAGLDVPQRSFAQARAFLEKMTDPATGFVSYSEGMQRTASVPMPGDRKPAALPTITAHALTVRLALGDSFETPSLKAGFKLISRHPAAWERTSPTRTDFFYWYYAALASACAGERLYKEWMQPLEAVLLQNQEKSGCQSGSWPPDDRWGHAGGRVYSTAMCILILQTPFNRPADFFISVPAAPEDAPAPPVKGEKEGGRK